MRLFGSGLLAIMVVAVAVIWLRGAPAPAQPAPAGRTAAIASVDERVTNRTLNAGDAVRHARAPLSSSLAEAHEPAREIAAAPHRAREMSRPRDDAQSMTDTEAPKPAGELFVPFIANDPTQVFAPATANFHAAVQSEASDPQWGPPAAAALRGYIESQFGTRFEIPYVDCREDLCELQVAGRIGNDLRRDTRDIQDAMNRMKQESWWTQLQFDQESGTVGSSSDGRLILLWFFSRK